MSLSNTERAFLVQYKKYKDNPPTFWRLLYMSLPLYVFVLIPLWAISSFWLALGQAFNAWLVWGFACGFIFRDFQILRKYVRFWPIQLQTMDWRKVEELLAADGQVESKTPDMTLD